MSLETQHLEALRRVINENLRVQRGGADPVPYIDVSRALSDIRARQNHAVFARRGCGKTLLLNHSAKELPGDVRPVYLNCMIKDIIIHIVGRSRKEPFGHTSYLSRSRGALSPAGP